LESLQKGPDVFLRHPAHDDFAEYLALVAASRRLHRPWVYPSTAARGFAAYVERASSERFFGCLICLRETGAIVGVANLSEVVRGVFQSAYLGFYGHAGYAGRGLMRQGVALLLRYTFHRLRLHRIEANVQPGNTRSVALVRGLGFRREGLSPKYLKIGGRWRDHERWALLAEEWRAGA
jgi:[ribosomal protein S5]-alanine N-acetyltransferase